MKQWIIPVVAGLGFAATTTMTQASEHAYLYKDSRIMAMGGANVAVGGYSASLFSNPAGLANLPMDHGMVVELLGLSLTASKNGKDIVEDIMDAVDTEDTDQILDVFTKYSGTFVHTDVSNYSSISQNYGNIAWSVGLLAATDINITPHASSYDLLEVQARGYGGLTFGYAHTLTDLGIGDLKLGVGGKVITQKSFEGALTPDDLIDLDNVGDDLRDKMEKDGSGFGLDLGLIYEFQNEIPLSPAVGLSVMNIGSLDFDDVYGQQPTTVNLGIAISPEIPYIHKTKIGLDYMDLFNANKTRIYNLDTANGEVSFSDYDDSDFIKRLRLGVSATIYDNSWSTLELATGIYQGNLTGGIDFTVAAMRFGLSTYAEQIGPAYNDDTDRRYTANIGIAW